jgi:TonB family protein
MRDAAKAQKEDLRDKDIFLFNLFWSSRLRGSARDFQDMKITATLFLLCVVINSGWQSTEFERQALSSVQRRLASSFDEGLPRQPFSLWFKEMAGDRAGVIWQLSECGDPEGAADKGEEMPACAEVNAVLSNGSKVVVMILVGTFKKGLIGEPSFLGAVIEYNDQFYRVSRLRDLPKSVRDPGSRPVSLPGVTAKQALLKMRYQSLPAPEMTRLEKSANGSEEQLPPPPRKVEELVVQGWAVTRVKPIYPANAKKMNAFGAVEVRIIISPDGKVIEARAISGHFALRGAAVEAAHGWIFKPSTIDGVPVNTESVLTFFFARGSK